MNQTSAFVTLHTKCHCRGDPSDDGACIGSAVGFHLDVVIEVQLRNKSNFDCWRQARKTVSEKLA